MWAANRRHGLLFETAAAASDDGPVVAIVPDGYWVGDRSRPLEIEKFLRAGP